MTSYRETIKRYPRTLSMPIVFTVVIALWVVAGSPKHYQAGASLWVDHLPPAPSSLVEDNAAVQTPAQQEQAIINELLSTHDFRVTVGHKGPLAAYLASNPAKGWGPSRLLSGLRGAQPLDYQIIAALGPKQLTNEVTGPQVLQLTFRSTSPTVAAGTVKALIDEIRTRLSSFATERNRTTIALGQADVDSASRAVADARKRVDQYRVDNPGTSPADPHLNALVKAQRAAAKDLSAATSRLNQLSSGDSAAAPGTSFSVIDNPRVPPGPVSGKKMLVMALFGGLFVGLLISGLALIALTPSKPPAPEGRPELREVSAPRDRDEVPVSEPEPVGAERR